MVSYSNPKAMEIGLIETIDDFLDEVAGGTETLFHRSTIIHVESYMLIK